MFGMMYGWLVLIYLLVMGAGRLLMLLLKRLVEVIYFGYKLHLITCVKILQIEKQTLRRESCRSSRPEVFCKNGVLKNFSKFAEKHLRQNLFLNKIIKARLWCGSLLVNFVAFLRKLFLQKSSKQLFLQNTLWMLLQHYYNIIKKRLHCISIFLNFYKTFSSVFFVTPPGDTFLRP